MTWAFRETFRALLAGLGAVIAFPALALAACDRYNGGRDDGFTLGGQLLALVPGIIGDAARGAYYGRTLALFEPGASVHFGSYFSKRGARVHARAGVGAYCVMGLVDLGPGVRVASRVSITSGLYYHGSAAGGISAEDVITRVVIGANTWIGEGAVIGANVGADCIVGMGSVVIQAVPDHSTVIGNPARRVPSVA
jgi:acetyltransferase-like isoleucine patch superfamily enzyme